MLPLENKAADYVKETGNHVLYRVTPVFEGSNLVASGVLMEAESVEDKGEGILCCVYVYNVQPGININYATGDSSASGTNKTAVTEQATQAVTQAASQQTSTESYILNTNTKKFHRPSCSSVKQMKESDKKSSSESRDALIAAGYDPCKKCNPQKCVRYLKNMEEEGCSSILQYFFFAHIGYVVEGDCCTQKISCAGLR